MTTRRNPPPHRYVYVIGPAVGLQKVGLATDPRSRLAALQTACPFDLVLHAAVRVPFGDAHAIERRAHRALVRACVRNEWFQTTPAEAMSAVQAAALGTGWPALAMPTEWVGRPARPAASVEPEAKPQAASVPTVSAELLPLFAFSREPTPDHVPALAAQRSGWGQVLRRAVRRG